MFPIFRSGRRLNSSRRSAWHLLTVVLLLVSCSRTPKEMAIAGFMEECRSIDNPDVVAYCDCMEEKLDTSITAKVFNDPQIEQGILLNAFAAEVGRLTPICKPDALPIATAATAQSPDVLSPPSSGDDTRSKAEDVEGSSQQMPSATASPDDPVTAAQPSAWWLALQQQLRDDPQGYVRQCVENDIRTAKQYGGLSQDEAVAHVGGGEACQRLLVDLQNCMKLDPTSSERCHDAFTQDRE